MTHIIAIGGGEIGRPGFPVETTDIDKQVIARTGKKRPKVLFLPTASADSPFYFELFSKHYGERLGCDVSTLNLYARPSQTAVKQAILNSDIIYVGGGNTLKMMTLWRRTGVDHLLVKAGDNGTILSGLSAGAICWFRAGLSDSRRFTSNGRTWDYINVHGLNIKDLILCPHYDAEPKLQPALRKSLRGTRKVAVALDDCTALEINGDTFRILSSKRGAVGHKAYWKDARYYVVPIEPSQQYEPLASLNIH